MKQNPIEIATLVVESALNFFKSNKNFGAVTTMSNLCPHKFH